MLSTLEEIPECSILSDLIQGGRSQVRDTKAKGATVPVGLSKTNLVSTEVLASALGISPHSMPRLETL